MSKIEDRVVHPIPWWEAQDPSIAWHPEDTNKARAVRAVYGEFIQAGFTYGVIADTDGAVFRVTIRVLHAPGRTEWCLQRNGYGFTFAAAKAHALRMLRTEAEHRKKAHQQTLVACARARAEATLLEQEAHRLDVAFDALLARLP
ncbi:hypothetical protein EBT31_06480 [bacterium]|nr:hypothetical protein [bacterium]